MKRNQWITVPALALLLMGAGSVHAYAQQSFESKRPAIEKRHFSSKAVEQLIAEVKDAITDPKLKWMFENCYPNTLDTTVKFQMKGKKPDTFVITGDIEAMWLRDSSAQVWPYLQLLKQDKELQLLVAGLICLLYTSDAADELDEV